MNDNKYDLHVTNYVLDGFEHLMTDIEIYALKKSMTFSIEHEDGSNEDNVVTTLVKGKSLESKVQELLADGMKSFRFKTARRILNEHESEVLQNQCNQCHRLPRTSKAKQCNWCGNSWRE